MRVQLCVALVAIALVCAHVAAQEETAERSVQNVPNQGGGKVTLISNKNTLTHIQQAPKYIDNQAKQEQAEKFATEEKQKKSSEEDMKNSKEADAKKQQATEQAGKKELEEGQKKILQEAADKKADEEKQKAAEADTKAKDKAAEEKTKSDESATKKAAEAKEKDEKQKSDEAAKKKQDEADQKKADEQKEKDDVNLKFNSGWTNYQNSYEVAHCYNWDRYTMVHGLVRGWDGFVGTLGTKCRPSGRLIFTGMRGREARVDVLADGRVYLITSGDGSDWLSLDNIHFDREIQNGLGLGGGKYPYGGEYRQPSQTNAQGLCAYSGLVAGSQGGYYATAMGGCTPGAYLMFTANNHDNTIGMYMDPSGNTYHHDTGINNGWVALDGIMWSAQVSGWLNLYNGYYNYGGGWRSASYTRIGNICVLGGLMGASFNSMITNLPPGCRPRARLIFPVHNPGRAARVDVTPDGNVYYISYGTSSWMSLSNIQFVAYN